MHMHSLAPVLSATSRYVYIWIIASLPSNQPRARARGLSQHPSLALGAGSFIPSRRRGGCRHVGDGRRAAGAFGDDAHQAPVLHLGQRPGLHDLDRVADLRLVLLVVDVTDRPPADVLAVARVLDQARDLDA